MMECETCMVSQRLNGVPQMLVRHRQMGVGDDEER